MVNLIRKLILSAIMLSINNQIINFYSKNEIQKVPWSENNLNLVIDAQGVEKNVINSKKF